MPTYDYKCQSCGHQFEHFQSMNDPRLTECPLPECAGPVKRLLGTGAGIIFKGSGFYQTDYRSDSYAKGASAESKASEGTAAKTETKTETKSESTTTSAAPAPAAAPSSTPKTTP
jgi:putative FmdB family regulatory protein